MKVTKVDTLRVPGADLYYQARGSGPILLMIAAGGGDADSYNSFVDYLTDQYTVVTYDRRGYSRSPLDDPNRPIEIETHSDDVHRLLAVLTTEPARVFGSSIGALIGLDLVIRHSEQVRTLVAHEPPVGQLLSDAERANEGLLEMYRRDGATAAIQKFAESIGVHHHGRQSNNGLLQKDTQNARQNRESFFKYDARAVGRYMLDIDALRVVPTQIVLAGGRDGQKYFPYRGAASLANCLGITITEFPGNHAGFVDCPREFAERLWEILDD